MFDQERGKRRIVDHLAALCNMIGCRTSSVSTPSTLHTSAERPVAEPALTPYPSLSAICRRKHDTCSRGLNTDFSAPCEPLIRPRCYLTEFRRNQNTNCIISILVKREEVKKTPLNKRSPDPDRGYHSSDSLSDCSGTSETEMMVETETVDEPWSDEEDDDSGLSPMDRKTLSMLEPPVIPYAETEVQRHIRSQKINNFDRMYADAAKPACRKDCSKKVVRFNAHVTRVQYGLSF